jgi:hypothetical protein
MEGQGPFKPQTALLRRRPSVGTGRRSGVSQTSWEKFYDGNFGEPGLGGRETAVFDSYASEKVTCM